MTIRAVASMCLAAVFCLAAVGCGGGTPKNPAAGFDPKKLADQHAAAKKETDPETKTIQFVKIARGYAKGKMMDKARDVLSDARGSAAEIKDPTNRAKQLVEVATAQGEAGSTAVDATLAQARKAVDELPDPTSKARLLAALGAARFKSGSKTGAAEFFKEAQGIAEKLDKPEDELKVLLELSESMAEADDKAGADSAAASALKLAQGLEDLRAQCEAVADVALVQSKLKQADASKANFAAALETADKIPDQASKSFAYMKIAERMARAKQNAKEIFDKAEDLGNKITDGSVRTDFQAQLGMAKKNAYGK